eukprot:g9535.t1
MTLLMSNALILLLLVCLGESVAHQQLLRKPRAPPPLGETHGVTREVLESANHEQHFHHITKKAKNLSTEIPHSRSTVLSTNIPRLPKAQQKLNKCVKIDAPAICVGTNKFYYGTISSKHSLKVVNEAMMRLFEMLPLISGLLDKEEQDSFTKCIPKITNFLCHSTLPRCDSKCEPLKSCKQMCDDIFNGCISRHAVSSIRKILEGGSYRSVVLQSFMASEGNDVVDAFDGFIQMLTSPNCTSSDSETRAETTDETDSESDPETRAETTDETYSESNAIGATGEDSETDTEFSDEEKQELINNATGYLVENAAGKAKRALSGLVEKAWTYIDTEVKEGRKAVASYENSLNTSEAKPGIAQKEHPKQIEKAAADLIHVIGKEAKERFGKLFAKYSKNIDQADNKLGDAVSKGQKQIVNLSILRKEKNTKEAEALEVLKQQTGSNSSNEEDDASMCKLVQHLPCGSTKGSQGYMAHYNDEYSIENYTKAMNEFYGILPVLGVFHSIHTEMPPLRQCIRKIQRETCNVVFPKCNKKCEVQKPCHSSCTSFGKCSSWVSPAILDGMRPNSEHYYIVKSVVKDETILDIISNIVDMFTEKCTGEGKEKFYQLKQENSEDVGACSSPSSPRVKTCSPVENVEASE